MSAPLPFPAPCGDSLHDRAVCLAIQRAQTLAVAADPRCASERRKRLLKARRIEKVIVGIGEIAESQARMRGLLGAAR